jgi:hypothetical protein
MKQTTELKRSAFKRKPLSADHKQNFKSKLPTPKKLAKPLKAKKLAVTDDEKALWSKMASIGCIACLIDGISNSYVSIHHVDGRTKPGCHKKVLALCAPHHQHDVADPMHRIGVHPYKARFEKIYGTQTELMEKTRLLVEALG